MVKLNLYEKTISTIWQEYTNVTHVRRRTVCLSRMQVYKRLGYWTENTTFLKRSFIMLRIFKCFVEFEKRVIFWVWEMFTSALPRKSSDTNYIGTIFFLETYLDSKEIVLIIMAIWYVWLWWWKLFLLRRLWNVFCTNVSDGHYKNMQKRSKGPVCIMI